MVVPSTLDIPGGDVSSDLFLLLAGRSGGQDAAGGTDAADDLTLVATRSGTPGDIIFKANDANENGRFLSTGEFLVGATALFSSDTMAEFRNDRNAATTIAVINQENDTAAAAGVVVAAFSSTGVFVAFPPDFTSSGLRVADGVMLASDDAAGGLNSGTLSVAPLIWGTNNTERARLASGGEFLVGRTTTFSSFGAGEFQRNINGGVNIGILNTTDGVAASAGFIGYQSSGATLLTCTFRALSPSFTTAAGRESDSVVVEAGATANGLILLTNNATTIKVKTNQVERARFLSTGEFLVGATALIGSELMRVNGELAIDGDLNHDGSNVGLYGTAPAAQSAAYTRNAAIVTDRTLLASASATTLNNNNVLAALIEDLQSRGFIG